MSEKALYDDLKRIFGFKSLDARVRTALQQAVQGLLDRGEVVRSVEGIYRPKE